MTAGSVRTRVDFGSSVANYERCCFGPLLRGEIRIPRDVSIHDAYERLATALVEAKASRVGRSPGELSFRAGMVRLVTTANPLISTCAGRLRFDDDHHVVRYEVSLREALVVALLYATFVPGFASLSGAGLLSLLLCPIVFCATLGMNYLFGVHQFATYLRRRLANQRSLFPGLHRRELRR